MIEFLIPEKNLPYDPKNKDSVAKYTKLLENKTLNDFIQNNKANINSKNKGNFGQLIENIFFFIKTNNYDGADFPDIPLELKVAGVEPTSSRDRHVNISGDWKQKEVLPLSSISFNGIVKEEFYTSKFLEKNKNLLLIFYKYKSRQSPLDNEIKITGIWCFNEIPEHDKKIIIDDWEKIKSKVVKGDAHNLSKKDTNYLEAMPSNNVNSYTTQPFNKEKARTKKFAFKHGYMHSVIAKLGSSNIQTESLYKEGDENISLSEKIYEKFKPYIGMSGDEIASILGIENLDCKNAYSSVTNKLLNKIFNVPDNKKIGSYIEEFSKAEITIKTIRVSENNLPKEHISFPAFKYENIIKQSWDDSEFKNHIDKKFLFIFFKESGSSFVLDKAVYWNMSSEHISEAQKVWEETKQLIEEGKIVKDIKVLKNGKKKRLTYFPGSKSNLVSHVRPHATTIKDTYSLPVRDIYTGWDEYTKHCFWLNKEFVKNYIYFSI